jgi:hypothetical protein
MKLLLTNLKAETEKSTFGAIKIDGIKKLLMIMFQNGKLLLMLCPLVVLMSRVFCRVLC